jgi:long-chain acyl-CoA synthetase
MSEAGASALPGFIERFLAHVEATPEAVAIESEGVRVDYAALLATMERFQGRLSALGVGEGDRVFLALPAGADFVACFYAAASLGAVCVPTSVSLTPFERAAVLREAKPSLAVVASRAVAIDGAPSSLRAVVTPDDLRAGAPRPLAPPREDAIISCHFTYKGLGYPLGALHRYASYSHCIEGLASRYASDPGDTHLAALPIYPVYSLLGAILGPLSLGGRVVQATSDGGRELAALLATHRARFACVVPMLLRVLVARVRARRRSGSLAADLHPDLALMCGGSHLPVELATEVALTTGIEPLQGYGLTETLPVVVTPPGRVRRGALGVPLSDHVRIAVLDADGRELPAGRVGEITVFGPTVTAGYLGRPAETARFLVDGGFRTGDLGHFDDEGFVHFDGRALPFTKCAAQMVDLVEIEELLRRHPGIADARAVVKDEHVTAFARVTRGAAVTEREALEYCKRHLSRHKVPRRITLQANVTAFEVAS